MKMNVHFLLKDLRVLSLSPRERDRVRERILSAVLIGGLTLAPSASLAFNSGSSGVDGAFNPTANTTLTLPPSGAFHFTTVNIPAGVTVTFNRNAANTPVIFLASGNVTIAGTINLDGRTAAPTGTAGNGNIADDGIPGQGGAGGYDGGTGGAELGGQAGAGLGPGGGIGGRAFFISGVGWFNAGGGGGGFASSGAHGSQAPSSSPGVGGGAYGASTLLPLIGGSGGGGGGAGTTFKGTGGGGGGGAILIASSGTVTITGRIDANGADASFSGGSGCGAGGGAGSGGAIRIVATTVTGEGPLSAVGGLGTSGACFGGGGGGTGRIRIEAEFMQRTSTNANPAYTFAAPGGLFVAGLPRLNITTVAGVTVPTDGSALTLPSSTPNPITVEFATIGVPTGNTIRLTVTPTNGAPVIATSSALSGSTVSATATASVNLPTGASTFQAAVSYTVTTAMGQELSKFAQGERVERLELSANTRGEAVTTLITVSGKRYTWPAKSIAGIMG